ncbi:MAG: hypothetical protein ACI4I4_07015 [Acutalibacteraceae bacterium]
MVLLLLSALVIKVVGFILSLLPDISIPVFEVPNLFIQIINLLNYILPMDTLGTLFGLTIAITSFRITLAIINKILSLIEVIS